MTTEEDMGKHKNKDMREEEQVQVDNAHILDNPTENIEPKPKKKSKKKKERNELEESAQAEGDAPVKKHNKHKKRHDDYSGTDDVPKKSKKKRKHADSHQDEGILDATDVDGGSAKKKRENHDAPETEEEHVEHVEEVAFPPADLPKLFDRIEAGIPSNDSMSFKSRCKRLNWEEIAFDDYNAEKCQNVWQSIQKSQRQNRLLREMVADAKEWIKAPSKNSKHSKNHPDYPKRPLSAYMLYQQERKRAILEQNPGIKVPEMAKLLGQEFNELPEDTKQRYAQMANKRRAEYEQECEDFYERHPDVPRSSETRQDRREIKTRKPTTPFNLFLESEIKKEGNVTDKAAFKETCKERWRNLPEKGKVVWIDWALDLENKFQEEIRNIQHTNPNYEPPPTFKNVLTKEEKQLKERMSGKPEKPPNSAYSLFSRIILKSDKLKDIDTKERMRVIATDWKNLPQEDKDNYRDQTTVLMEQYKVDYAAFLDSLSVEERAKELQKAIPKRRLTKAAEEQLAQNPVREKVNCKIKSEDVIPPVLEKNPLLNAVTPQNWSDMKENERSMYMKYVIKIKDYFDAQHQNASRSSDSSSSSDSQGDSDSSTD